MNAAKTTELGISTFANLARRVEGSTEADLVGFCSVLSIRDLRAVRDADLIALVGIVRRAAATELAARDEEDRV